MKIEKTFFRKCRKSENEELPLEGKQENAELAFGVRSRFIRLLAPAFFDFQDIAGIVIQRFAKTRSHTKCEKGFGNSQQAKANS